MKIIPMIMVTGLITISAAFSQPATNDSSTSLKQLKWVYSFSEPSKPASCKYSCDEQVKQKIEDDIITSEDNKNATGSFGMGPYTRQCYVKCICMGGPKSKVRTRFPTIRAKCNALEGIKPSQSKFVWWNPFTWF